MTAILLPQSSAARYVSHAAAHKSAVKFRKNAGFSERRALLSRLAAYLRRMAPQKTAEAVAAATGLPAATVGNWLDGKAAPNGTAMIRLILAFGANFLAEVMGQPPTWIATAAAEERRRKLTEMKAAIEAELHAATGE